jgi:hypothetical protein
MIEVGDMVQVEIAGAFCLDEPARVTDIIPHGEDTYVLVEGSMSAVLIANVVKQ